MVREVLIGAGYKEEERALVSKYSREEDVHDFLERYGMSIRWIEQTKSLPKGAKLDYLVYPSNEDLPGIIDVDDSPSEKSKYYKAFIEASKSKNPLVAFKALMDEKKSDLKILK